MIHFMIHFMMAFIYYVSANCENATFIDTDLDNYNILRHSSLSTKCWYSHCHSTISGIMPMPGSCTGVVGLHWAT